MQIFREGCPLCTYHRRQPLSGSASCRFQQNRGDRITTDVAAAQFFCANFCKTDDACFACRIARLSCISVSPMIELMLMIDPLRAFIMGFITCLVMLKTLFRFTRITSSHCSGHTQQQIVFGNAGIVYADINASEFFYHICNKCFAFCKVDRRYFYRPWLLLTDR